MKYIKDFTHYLNENENNNNKDFEFSIFNIFKPFFRLISNLNTEIKLINIIDEYDKYLYSVYIEYLERKKHIPKEELEKFEISTIGQDNIIHIDTDESEIETDLVLEPESELEPEPVSISEPEPIDNKIEDVDKKDIKTPIVNKTPVNKELPKVAYSSKKSIRKSPFYDEYDSENFAEMLDENVAKNNISFLKELKQEYQESLKNSTSKYSILKKDFNNYFRKRNKLNVDILSHDKNSYEYKIINKKLKQYDGAISELDNKMKKIHSQIGQQKLYLMEVTKAIVYLNTLNSAVEPVKESHDWTGNAVYDLEWTESDMHKITSLINPFQIEEFYLKAENIISISKNPEKFKYKWNLYLNSLYKKWYYTFDVNNFKNILQNLNNKGSNKKDVEIKKNLAYSSIILEELFHTMKSYSYNFKSLSSDRYKYFILLCNNDMFLMKKVLFMNNNTYCFQLLSSLKPNKDNTFIVATKLLNNLDDKITMNINYKDIPLYKEKHHYPIFFIQDGDFYGSKDFHDFDKVSLKNCNIYSLKDSSFNKIIKNSNVHYEDKLPSEETFEKIKKTTL